MTAEERVSAYVEHDTRSVYGGSIFGGPSMPIVQLTRDDICIILEDIKLLREDYKSALVREKELWRLIE